MDLHLFWFWVLGLLLTGYAILDGFDLGVGTLHLAAKSDHDRRVLMNSIGPIWDGNEVWLVTFGGALFAAFPTAYAAAFSGLYIPLMLVLFALIFRAVSMEFRGKREGRVWRLCWDVAFFASSTLASVLFGVAVGGCMRGLPIGADGFFHGNFLAIITPYSLLVGVLTASLFTMHGAIYLYLKTTDELQQRVLGWIWRSFGFFVTLYMLTTIFTLVTIPEVTRNFRAIPLSWAVVVLNVLAVANIPRSIYRGRPLQAFVSSACTIAALTFLFGIALFPNLITSSLDPSWSLTVYNAASSEKTLRLMRLITFIGMPFVLTYTTVVYWVFRGKVELGKTSY